ncbi:MAG: hypothetical protein BWY58_00953 [Chloroflexi bacterium ADurb.Bin344]|nr:MAG: hypothetical protein BWY58_00953 [Chloroflexi bacterium ADurb.Bin344]
MPAPVGVTSSLAMEEGLILACISCNSQAVAGAGIGNRPCCVMTSPLPRGSGEEKI